MENRHCFHDYEVKIGKMDRKLHKHQEAYKNFIVDFFSLYTNINNIFIRIVT